MNLDEQWVNMEAEDDKDLSGMLQPGFEKNTSKGPLEKLKRNLLVNAYCGVVISIGYILILCFFRFWQLYVTLGLLFVFTVVAAIQAFKLRARMNNTSHDAPLLQTLESYYASVKGWVSMQEKAGLFIYPFASAGGFMWGGYMGSGLPIGVFMQKPVVYISFIIITAILIPLCYYLARWMNKKAFGQYIQQLKENIDILKTEK